MELYCLLSFYKLVYSHYVCSLLIFFFKQKTAYEIDCDWSSDVCSSDLRRQRGVATARTAKHWRRKRWRYSAKSGQERTSAWFAWHKALLDGCNTTSPARDRCGRNRSRSHAKSVIMSNRRTRCSPWRRSPSRKAACMTPSTKHSTPWKSSSGITMSRSPPWLSTSSHRCWFLRSHRWRRASVGRQHNCAARWAVECTPKPAAYRPSRPSRRSVSAATAIGRRSRKAAGWICTEPSISRGDSPNARHNHAEPSRGHRHNGEDRAGDRADGRSGCAHQESHLHRPCAVV